MLVLSIFDLGKAMMIVTIKINKAIIILYFFFEINVKIITTIIAKYAPRENVRIVKIRGIVTKMYLKKRFKYLKSSEAYKYHAIIKRIDAAIGGSKYNPTSR